MFGQGNPTPRPGASLQQLPLGLPQPFQQGGHGPGRPVMQNLSNQSGSQVDQTTPMPPHPHVQQVPQSGSIGLYAHGPQHNIGSRRSPYPHYPPVQHNFQHPPQLGVQNSHHIPSPRSSLPPPRPPPSHGFQCSELLTPPSSGYTIHGGVGQPTQPTGHQGFPHIQPPQLPPFDSVLITHSESSSMATPNDSRVVFTNPPPTLLHSSPPPVPPARPPSGLPGSDGKELTSAVVIAASESPSVLQSSVGCPDTIKMNGVDADNEPTLTSHNNNLSEIVDRIYSKGEARVSKVTCSLDMNSKSEHLRPEAGPSSQLNSLTGGGLCSPSDSDMDMEDVIIHLVEDLETYDSLKDQNGVNLTQAESLDVKEQLSGKSPKPASFSGLPKEGVVCAHLRGQPSSTESPIKVLQGYASDDSSEKLRATNVNDVSHTLPAIDESGILKTVGEPDPVNDNRSKNHCITYEESNPVTLEHSLMQQVTAFGKETERDIKDSSTTFVAVSKPAELAKRDGSKEYMCDESQHLSQVNSHLKPDDMTSMRRKSSAEDTTACLQLKVDEFGRLAKDISSDSESDDRLNSRKRGRRGRSRSISPFDKRRKAPLRRRRNNRSRSRSRSPLRRISRSRSPSYRRPTEFISERRRRDRIQTSVCFNYRDGRCHRGSSCRFLHHDSDKSGTSNSYKRKHLPEAAHGDKGSTFQERSKGSSSEMGFHRDGRDISHGSHQLNNTNCVHPDSGRDNNVSDKNDVGQGITVVNRAHLDHDDHTVASYLDKCEGVGGETAHVVEASTARVAQDQDATNLPGYDKYQKSALSCHPYDANSFPPLVNSFSVLSSKEPLGANQSVGVHQYADLQPQKPNISYDSMYVQHQSLGTPNPFTTGDSRQDSVPSSSLSYAKTGSRIQPVRSEDFSSQVPSSVNGTPLSQATTGHYMPKLQSSFSLMQTPTGLPPPFMSGSGPSYNQYLLPNQPPQSSVRPIPLWTSLPPPLPPVSIYADTPNANNSTSGKTIPYHFERNQQPQRTDVALQSVSGPYSGHMHYNSQYSGNRPDNYHPSVETPRPPFAFSAQRPNSHFAVNTQTQLIEGFHLERNDQTSVQGLNPSACHLQPISSSVDPPATKTLPSSKTDCDVSSQSDKVLKNTNLNDPRKSVPSDSRIIVMSGKIQSRSLRTSPVTLNVSGISEFGHSRPSVQCDMYISASDRPLASMASQPQMVGAQGIGVHGLRERSPSSISIRIAEQNFPGSGGGQYDPLLDSIDKSSNSLVISEQVKKQRSTSVSDNMLRGTISHKPLDVEETNRKKEIEAIASLTSSDNEEFGETADAELGALENESFSNPVDMPNRDSEVATSVTFPDKKSKDSRSMKLFKSAIANFAKDVLKPSWRQGNMSKEAFKTIVKKTVEKVSGAMKGHRYPKSHARINHYIESSERKLTKLVMGYVDKYVEV